MNSIEKTTLTVDPQSIAINPQQTNIPALLEETTKKILQQIVFTIRDFKNEPETLTSVLNKLEAPLPEIDERTKKVFQKLGKISSKKLEKFMEYCSIPYLLNSFINFDDTEKQNKLMKQMLEKASLNHTQNLIIELDKINSSLVDELINNKE